MSHVDMHVDVCYQPLERPSIGRIFPISFDFLRLSWETSTKEDSILHDDLRRRFACSSCSFGSRVLSRWVVAKRKRVCNDCLALDAGSERTRFSFARIAMRGFAATLAFGPTWPRVAAGRGSVRPSPLHMSWKMAAAMILAATPPPLAAINVWLRGLRQVSPRRPLFFALAVTPIRGGVRAAHRDDFGTLTKWPADFRSIWMNTRMNTFIIMALIGTRTCCLLA